MAGFEGVERLAREVAEIKKTTPQEERELARRIAQGDRGAIERLVAGNLHVILPIARAKATKRDGCWDGRDLFNEAVVAVTKGARNWTPRGGRPFSAYARIRARGAIRDFLRRRADVVRGTATSGRALSLDAGESELEGDQWTACPGRAVEMDVLEQALAALPRPERAVLERRVFAERIQSVETAARELGVREDTIRRRQSRGMERLIKTVRLVLDS